MSAGGTLTDRTTRAAQWRLVGSAVDAVCQLGVGVLLARLLDPSDFGVMALGFVVLSLVRPFGDLGMAGAVVQRRNLTERHVRVAFTFSVLLGAAVAVAIALAAPLAAVAMKQAPVTPVLRWLSLGFALQGPSVVSEALMRRRLDFRRRFFVNTGSYLVGYGLISVALALSGFGVWSLVYGGLAQTLLSTVLTMAVARHPLRPLLAQPELGELLSFGVGASLSNVVNILARNGDNFVVGRWLGPASLGLYNRAYQLMNLPFTYTATALSSVLFPAMSEVQNEAVRLRRAYLLLTRLVAVVSAAAMGTLAIVAPHLIVCLFGPNWTGTIAPLQVFCVAGYFRALYHISGIVAQSAGRIYGDLRNQIIYALLVLIGAYVGTRFGLVGAAVGVSLAIGYMFVATGRLALSATATAWSEYAAVQMLPLTVGAATCGVAAVVRLALEHARASRWTIALAVLAAAAVPSAAGVLWVLSDPEFVPVLRNFPGGFVRLTTRVNRLRLRR